MRTPNTTTIQVVALVQAVLGLCVAFGAPVSSEQSEAIIQVVTALAVSLPVSDAVIRNGRARNAGELERVQDRDW
jgi:hypothetical protein